MSEESMKEAKYFSEVVEETSVDVDYLHVCTNNTVYDTEYRKNIDMDIPLIDC